MACPSNQRTKRVIPALEVSLILDDRVLNLSMSEADAAIRLYDTEVPDMVQVHLSDIHFHICASREYLAQHGMPKSIKELRKHALIGYTQGGTAPFIEPNWLFKKAGVETENNPNLTRMNSLYSIYEAGRYSV